MKHGRALVFGLIAMAAALPLLDAGEQNSAERLPFAPGGTIHISGSYGYLTVEGWDEPEVELKVVKSGELPEQRLEQVRVVTERHSARELDISTVPPVRKSLFRSVVFMARPLLPNERRGITLDCRIHVPRDSKLVVQQDNGYIWVGGLTGDIQVNSHTGDMIVMLPEAGPYAIDAKTRLGSISSDFAGKGNKQFLVGTHFSSAGNPQPRQIRLRMGRGSIEIQAGEASPPARKTGI